jgi:hypothetical protein
MALGTALLLLAPALSALQGAVEASSSLDVPAFRLGESARYDYSVSGTPYTLNYTVDRLGQALDMAARQVNVTVFTQHAASGSVEERVSVESMLVESRLFTCPVRTNGQCDPWEQILWTEQGRPGVWGAALVQGRSVTVGQSWTIPGTCLACPGPRVVSVEAPGPTSPAGTAFVLAVTGSVHASTTDHLHMALDHPFPLLAEVHLEPGLVTYRLTAHAPGTGTTIPAPATPAAPGYPRALPPSVPFVGGRPVEGAPFGDHATWAEARAAIGPDPLDADPSLTLVLLSNQVYPVGVRIGSQVTPWERYDAIDARFGHPGSNDTGVSYQRHEYRPADRPLSPDAWTSTGYSAHPWGFSPGSLCAPSAPPLWDVVRHGASLGLLSDVRGYRWILAPEPWDACEGGIVEVDGPVHSLFGEAPVGAGMEGSGFAESIRYDSQTGLLTGAMLWPPAVSVPSSP